MINHLMTLSVTSGTKKKKEKKFFVKWNKYYLYFVDESLPLITVHILVDSTRD